MTLEQILAKAEVSTAAQFEQFLTDNKIKNTWLEVCLSDYNEGYYNITLDDYDDYAVLFSDGVYQK